MPLVSSSILLVRFKLSKSENEVMALSGRPEADGTYLVSDTNGHFVVVCISSGTGFI